MSTDETVSPRPRWSVVIVPVDNTGECQIQVEANAPDVYYGEIGFGLSKVVTSFIRAPNARVPTKAEAQEAARLQEITRAHPATRLWAKVGRQTLWLGDNAWMTHQDALREAGWVDAGQVPDGMVKACDAVLDPTLITRACAPSPLVPSPPPPPEG